MLFVVLFTYSLFVAPWGLFSFWITLPFAVIMFLLYLFLGKRRPKPGLKPRYDATLLIPLAAAPIIATALALIGEAVMSKIDSSFAVWPPIPNIGQYEPILRPVPMGVVVLATVYCLSAYIARKTNREQALLVYACELFYLFMMALSEQTTGVPVTLWP